ncbi:hypothetical protein O0S10_01985 [Methanocorpusculum sp. MG]|uniref:DUF4430 domain-containing protein n=1 Tax=Methanocorpusculum petauri TaxID=3002863 RepID=A0ABT4IFU0_9EURY|nr:hypothetical protein [Methanocorpusculum petauri]MCZ0859998.1 hypothetical protein [Methanocorpusculum petauri]
MQKEAFKIMGALLVLVLAVSFSVGAVSAASYSVDIIDGSLALTKDVPAWGAPDQTLGYFFDAETALGALREAYVENDISTYEITFAYNTNNVGEYTITDINGVSSAGSVWYPFVGTTYAPTTATPVTSASNVVTFLLAESGHEAALLSGEEGFDDISEIAENNVDITVTFTNPVFSISQSISVPNGTTGLGVLDAAKAQNIITSYTNTSYTDDQGVYAWLESINGVYSYNWYKTGYGYAILKNNAPTDALNRFSFTTELPNPDTFGIYMAPSTYGGQYPLATATGGYFIDKATEKLVLSVGISA